MKKIREYKNEIELFFRTTLFTFIIIACVTFAWQGSCSIFEAVQSRLFGDTRPAVIVDSGHIKIFELEFFF